MPKYPVTELPPLSRKKIWLIRLLVVAVIAGVLGILARQGYQRVRERSMIASCWNHSSFVHYGLLEHYPGGDVEARAYKELPYDPDLPGYGMLAKYAAEFDAVVVTDSESGEAHYAIQTSAQSGLNCHHGAPDEGNGGWNAVNLPMEKWEKLWAAHLQLLQNEKPEGNYRNALPFYWCGGPNPIESRAGAVVGFANGEWSIDRYAITDADLAHLNDCLVAIGEPPMDWDVPQGVDWDVFRNDNSYKRIADHTAEDGKVVYRITPRRGE